MKRGIDVTRRRLAVVLMLMSVVLVACEDLAVGGTGEVEVFATANAQGTTPYQGLLSMGLQVYLQRDGGQWVEVTDGMRDLTLDLRGVAQRRVSVRFLGGGRYTRLRAVFQSVEANITSGGGILGVVRVDPGNQPMITVEREVIVEVASGQGFDILIDMGVTTWLPTASPGTRLVSAATFRNAVAVRAP